MSKTPALIAVVDDEASVHKALRRLLRSAGFEVATYAAAADLYEALGSHAPDCLVLDLHMPQVSGFDVLAHLRSVASPLPVVVITGHASSELRARVLDGGAAAFLTKPIDETQLLKAIEACLERRGFR